jgi:N-carbamoylputrescine amidase
MSTVRVALTQMACGDDADANLTRQRGLIEQAAKSGAQIICTQELFRSKYFCQVEDHRFFQLAEPIPGPSTEAFQRLAGKLQVVVVAGGMDRRAAGR